MRTKLTPAFCQKATVQDERRADNLLGHGTAGFGLLVTKSGPPLIRRAVPRW